MDKGNDGVEVRIKLETGAYAFLLRKFGQHKAAGGKMNYGAFVGWFVSNMVDELSGEQKQIPNVSDKQGVLL